MRSMMTLNLAIAKLGRLVRELIRCAALKRCAAVFLELVVQHGRAFSLAAPKVVTNFLGVVVASDRG